MEKVIQELNAMYQEAGLSLYTVHLGGDEVPRGVWMALRNAGTDEGKRHDESS